MVVSAGIYRGFLTKDLIGESLYFMGEGFLTKELSGVSWGFP